MYLIPQAQFLVPMWFLKIWGKFCKNALSNWSNSRYIFLLPKTIDPVRAKFCICTFICIWGKIKGCVKLNFFCSYFIYPHGILKFLWLLIIFFAYRPKDQLRVDSYNMKHSGLKLKLSYSVQDVDIFQLYYITEV